MHHHFAGQHTCISKSARCITATMTVEYDGLIPVRKISYGPFGVDPLYILFGIGYSDSGCDQLGKSFMRGTLLIKRLRSFHVRYGDNRMDRLYRLHERIHFYIVRFDLPLFFFFQNVW